MPEWIKTIPKLAGFYWTATLDNQIAGIHVIYLDPATETFKDATAEDWQGYYWSQEIEKPPYPPPEQSPEQFVLMLMNDPQYHRPGFGPAPSPSEKYLKIQMIKEVRYRFNFGLKEAKQLVDRMIAMTPLDMLQLRKKDGK